MGAAFLTTEEPAHASSKSPGQMPRVVNCLVTRRPYPFSPALSRTSACLPETLCATEVIGYDTGDDVAQPRMRRLVAKPSQPDHGSFDRFGRTRQPMKNKTVGLNHVLGDIERKCRYQVRIRQNWRSRQERCTHRRPRDRLQLPGCGLDKVGSELSGRDFQLRQGWKLLRGEFPRPRRRVILAVHDDELILQ